jgi:hypothetical protein
MAPGISSDSILTRLSVGWLEDIGYQVNYNDVVAFSLPPNCICNRPKRRFVRHLGPMELNGALPSNTTTTTPKRKLSLKGYNAAMAAGLSHLNDVHKRHNDTASSARGSKTGFQFVGDQVVAVMYMEEGTMYGIVVHR